MSLRGVKAVSQPSFSERSEGLCLSVTSLTEVKAVSYHGFSFRSEGLYLRLVFLRGMKGCISTWFL